MPEVTAWQNRPLEAMYPFVFLDAIHYKVKENHQYQTKGYPAQGQQQNYRSEQDKRATIMMIAARLL